MPMVLFLKQNCKKTFYHEQQFYLKQQIFLCDVLFLDTIFIFLLRFEYIFECFLIECQNKSKTRSRIEKKNIWKIKKEREMLGKYSRQ